MKWSYVRAWRELCSYFYFPRANAAINKTEPNVQGQKGVKRKFAFHAHFPSHQYSSLSLCKHTNGRHMHTYIHVSSVQAHNRCSVGGHLRQDSFFNNNLPNTLTDKHKNTKKEKRKGERYRERKWREKVKQNHQDSRGFVCSVGAARAKRVAIKKLPLSSAKFWYFSHLFPCLYPH